MHRALITTTETRKVMTSPDKKNIHCLVMNRNKILFAILIFVCFIQLIYYTIEEYIKWIENQKELVLVTTVDDDQHRTESQTTTCHLPQLTPYDSSILDFVEKLQLMDCTKGHPLIFKSDVDPEKGKSLLVQVENPSKFGYSQCCYRSFGHKDGTKNEQIFSSDCTPISNDQTTTMVNETMDYVQVECVIEGQFAVVDMFGYIPYKTKVGERLKKVSSESSNLKNNKRKVNVLMFGLDGVSHMNFIRTMPLSHEYLTKNLSAFEMFGHVKVGDNTFPNVVPLLMGKSVEETENVSWNMNTSLDLCPFIWKNYSAQGYLTAYGEDANTLTAFNFQKPGLHHVPTDYYLHPLTSLQGKTIAHGGDAGPYWCYGPRLGLEVVLDYLKKLIVSIPIKYGKDTKYFQFIWSTSLTHERLNNGVMGDEHLLDTLKWLKHGDHLSDTVLIMVSDHGIRWGDIRSTLQGRIEERMPFVYFVLPQWFKDKYQGAVSNLRRNERRLTTPFDLHETLKDLLFLDNIEDERVRERHLRLEPLETLAPSSNGSFQQGEASSSKFPRGISLFLPIPLSRTCSDAGIEENWCVCRDMRPVPIKNNMLVKASALKVVSFMNKMFLKFPQCSNLTLDKILNAQVVQSSNQNVSDFSNQINSNVHQMKFYTKL